MDSPMEKEDDVALFKWAMSNKEKLDPTMQAILGLLEQKIKQGSEEETNDAKV
jgi:hypothetical protein